MSGDGITKPPFSVVIPAHNEAAVIGRCLKAILDGAPEDGEPQIIVVCNGCRDNTAELARAVSETIQVIELAIGSKPGALNAGNLAATAFPRFFLDADVVVSFADLSVVAAQLADGSTLAAAPSLFVDTAAASNGVKRYYRIWCALPYITDALIGSGIYGLSKEGLDRIGQFPDIISDDGYVRSRFAPGERRNIAADPAGRPITFTVYPPTTLRSLISIEVRRRAGDVELRKAGFLGSNSGPDNPVSAIWSVAWKDGRPWDAVIYLFVKVAARTLQKYQEKRGAVAVWQRDDSSRIGS